MFILSCSPFAFDVSLFIRTGPSCAIAITSFQLLLHTQRPMKPVRLYCQPVVHVSISMPPRTIRLAFPPSAYPYYNGSLMHGTYRSFPNLAYWPSSHLRLWCNILFWPAWVVTALALRLTVVTSLTVQHYLVSPRPCSVYLPTSLLGCSV